MYAIRSYYVTGLETGRELTEDIVTKLDAAIATFKETVAATRITSYNVCYTKLLRMTVFLGNRYSVNGRK